MGGAATDRRIWLLAACAAGAAACYAVATWRIPLWRYFPGNDGVTLDFPKMLGPGWEIPTVAYVSLVSATFALYAVALAVAWRMRRSGAPLPGWLVFGGAGLSAVALLAMYPPAAADMFHYHADARTLWIHGENPLTTAPGAFPYPIAYSWADQPSPYGPLWALLSGIPTLPAGDHTVAALLGFKLLAAASLLGCAAVIWLIVRRTRPGDEALAVLLFAWNPYVLLRVVGNGHNDLVMMLFVLLALAFMHRQRWTWALAMLVLSIMVKYVSLLLLPPFLVYAWYHTHGSPLQRAIEVARSLGVASLVGIALFAPFWEGPSTFDTIRGEAGKLITSTPIALAVIADGAAATEESMRRNVDVLRIAFVLAAIPLVWVGRRDVGRLAAASMMILLLYLILAAGWYRPWYMLWPVAIAALRPRSGLAAIALVASLGGTFPDLIEQFRGFWPPIADYTRAILAPIIVAFVPPLLAWVAMLAVTREWHLRSGDRPRG